MLTAPKRSVPVKVLLGPTRREEAEGEGGKQRERRDELITVTRLGCSVTSAKCEVHLLNNDSGVHTGCQQQHTHTGCQQQCTDTGCQQQCTDTGCQQQHTDTGCQQQHTDTGCQQQHTDTSGRWRLTFAFLKPTTNYYTAYKKHIAPKKLNDNKTKTNQVPKLFWVCFGVGVG